MGSMFEDKKVCAQYLSEFQLTLFDQLTNLLHCLLLVSLSRKLKDTKLMPTSLESIGVPLAPSTGLLQTATK